MKHIIKSILATFILCLLIISCEEVVNYDNINEDLALDSTDKGVTPGDSIVPPDTIVPPDSIPVPPDSTDIDPTDIDNLDSLFMAIEKLLPLCDSGTGVWLCGTDEPMDFSFLLNEWKLDSIEYKYPIWQDFETNTVDELIKLKYNNDGTYSVIDNLDSIALGYWKALPEKNNQIIMIEKSGKINTYHVMYSSYDNILQLAFINKDIDAIIINDYSLY